MHKIPSGFQYVSSTRGAKFDAANQIVTWFVGRLDRGQSIDLGVTLNATQPGSFTHMVRATSDQGVMSDAQTTTRVEGVSALAISVADLGRPRRNRPRSRLRHSNQKRRFGPGDQRHACLPVARRNPRSKTRPARPNMPKRATKSSSARSPASPRAKRSLIACRQPARSRA